MLLVWTGNTCPHYKTKEMPLLWRFIMKRKELFNILFGDSKLIMHGCKYLPCTDSRCEECGSYQYWEQEAVIPSRIAKCILNSQYGKAYYLDTDSLKVVHDVYHGGKTNAEEFKLAWQGWTKFPSLHNNMDWSMLKDIIDDALANGFEVKILNGTIYYREKH